MLTRKCSENRQYKKFLLLVEVALAMIKVLQGIDLQIGPAVSEELDRVVRHGTFVLIH
jgi:hypothetical protein